MAGRWTLEQLISFGPAIQANRTAEDHYLSAALGAIEMIRTEATAAYDLYMSVPVADEEVLEPVVEAYRDVGLRVVLVLLLADEPFHRMMPGLLHAYAATRLPPARTTDGGARKAVARGGGFRHPAVPRRCLRSRSDGRVADHSRPLQRRVASGALGGGPRARGRDAHPRGRVAGADRPGEAAPGRPIASHSSPGWER